MERSAFFHHPQGVLCRATFENFIAISFQNHLDQRAHAILILNQQDSLRAAVRFNTWLDYICVLDGLIYLRQVDSERSALTNIAEGPNVSATLLHDSIHGGESEPGSLADWFGGKERLENMRQNICADSHSVVFHCEQHIPSCLYARVLHSLALTQVFIESLDDQFAALWHRVPCV